MKKILLTIIMACFTLTMAAQPQIKVNYQGAKPTIMDFAWALVNYTPPEGDEVENAAIAQLQNALHRYRQGKAQPADERLVVDVKNGYICHEIMEDGYVIKSEMCYWNMEDGKHKLFAYNVQTTNDGISEPGEFDGLCLYDYTNATKKMTPYFGDLYLNLYDAGEGDHNTFELPRTGKDIIITTWYEVGQRKKTAKWNGLYFSVPQP
jgi:hypothetical protein